MYFTALLQLQQITWLSKSTFRLTTKKIKAKGKSPISALSTGPWPWPLRTSGNQVINDRVGMTPCQCSSLHSRDMYTYTHMHVRIQGPIKSTLVSWCSTYIHAYIYICTYTCDMHLINISWYWVEYKRRNICYKPVVNHCLHCPRGHAAMATHNKWEAGLKRPSSNDPVPVQFTFMRHVLTHTHACIHAAYTHIPVYIHIHAWRASSKYIAWALLHFKTWTAEPFVEQLVQTTDKESRGFVPLAVVGESTSGLPYKGQWCRYRFHIFCGAGINMYIHACPYTYIYILTCISQNYHVIFTVFQNIDNSTVWRAACSGYRQRRQRLRTTGLCRRIHPVDPHTKGSDAETVLMSHENSSLEY